MLTSKGVRAACPGPGFGGIKCSLPRRAHDKQVDGLELWAVLSWLNSVKEMCDGLRDC